MTIHILESYQLSEQYTPQTLFDVYKESILEELNRYSVLEYNLLRTAEMEFDRPNHLILTFDQTIIAKTRTDEIVEFLEKVVCERCGLDFVIEVEYRAPKESMLRKNAQKQLEQEVQSIVARTRLALAKSEGESQTKEKGTDAEMFVTTEAAGPESKKAAGKPSGAEKQFERKGEFRRKYEKNSFVFVIFCINS